MVQDIATTPRRSAENSAIVNRVSRWSLFGAFLVAVMLPVLEVRAQDSGVPAARLQLSATEFDAGQLGFGRFKASTTFEIRNTGTATVAIRKLRSSCLCVKATLSASKIEPGQRAQVSVDADASELLESSLDEAVFLYTSDPAQPLLKFKIHGVISHPIQVEPIGVSIGMNHRPVLFEGMTSVVLSSIDKRPLGRVRLEPSAPFIRAEGQEKAPGVYEVRIGFQPTPPLGRLREKVRVHTEHPEQPVVEIPVFGVITGDVTPARRVDFGLVAEARPATAKIQFPNRGTQDVDILESELRLNTPQSVAVPAEIDVAKNGRDFVITVRIPQPSPLSRLTGVLRLKTSHPDEPIVELPVAGAVTATRPFETATTPEAETRLRAVVADALARGDSVPPSDFFSRVLGGVMDDRAARLLVRVGGDLKEEMPVRLRALELVALLKSRVVCTELKTLATEDDFEFVRRFALVALVEAVGADAMPELLMAMEDDGAWVREDAATLLGRVGDERALKPLQRATRDPDDDARKAAHAALQVLLTRLKR